MEEMKEGYDDIEITDESEVDDNHKCVLENKKEQNETQLYEYNKENKFENDYSSLSNKKFQHKLFKACVLVIVIIFFLMIIGFIKVEFFKSTPNKSEEERQSIHNNSNVNIHEIQLHLINSKNSLSYLEEFKNSFKKINYENKTCSSKFYTNLSKSIPCIINNNKLANQINDTLKSLNAYINNKKEKGNINDEYRLNSEISKFLLNNKIEFDFYQGSYLDSWINEIKLKVSNKESTTVLSNTKIREEKNLDRTNLSLESYSYNRLLMITNEDPNINIECSISLSHIFNYNLETLFSSNEVKQNIILSATTGASYDEFLNMKNTPLIFISENSATNKASSNTLEYIINRDEVFFIPSYYLIRVNSCWQKDNKVDVDSVKTLNYSLSGYNRNLNNLMNVIVHGY